MLIQTPLLTNLMLSINIVVGYLENSFIKQQNHDLTCTASNTATSINLGSAGTVLECGRVCGSMGECRGFSFNETDGSCWGSNQIGCQAAADAVFYRKESQTQTQGCENGGNCTSPTDCGAPPFMPNGTVSAGDTMEGSTRSYSCDYGYGTTGTATTTCVHGTGWSAPTSTCTQLMCDSGWQKIDLSCYFTPGGGTGFQSDVFTAMDLCHSYDAYLVQLETEIESNAVESWFYSLYDTAVWMGLSDVDVEGTWVWINSSAPVNWTDWKTGRPDGGTTQNYCILSLGANWDDGASGFNKQPLCEKSAEPS